MGSPHLPHVDATTWRRYPERRGARRMLVRFHQCHGCHTILARQIVPEPDPELPELYEADWREHLPAPTLRSELVPLPRRPDDRLRRFGLRSSARHRGQGYLRRPIRSAHVVMELGVAGSGRPSSTRVSESAIAPRLDDIVPGDPPIWFPKTQGAGDLIGAAKRPFPSVGDEAFVYCTNCGAGQIIRRVQLTDRSNELPEPDATAALPPDRRCHCRCGCDWLPPGADFWRSGLCNLCSRPSHAQVPDDDDEAFGTL